MQAPIQKTSRSHFTAQLGNSIDLPATRQNLYSILQQEVAIGGQALQRGGADVAVTMFQSALQKLSADQPFYDHLVHNLLLSYKLLIEKLLKQGDTSTARDFLRAALRLEIRGEMANDTKFVRKFAGTFENLSIVLCQHNLSGESVL